MIRCDAQRRSQVTRIAVVKLIVPPYNTAVHCNDTDIPPGGVESFVDHRLDPGCVSARSPSGPCRRIQPLRPPPQQPVYRESVISIARSFFPGSPHPGRGYRRGSRREWSAESRDATRRGTIVSISIVWVFNFCRQQVSHGQLGDLDVRDDLMAADTKSLTS